MRGAGTGEVAMTLDNVARLRGDGVRNRRDGTRLTPARLCHALRGYAAARAVALGEAASLPRGAVRLAILTYRKKMRRPMPYKKLWKRAA